MADTVKVEYLYPPNMLDGDWDEKQGNRRVIVRMSGYSDGTGETDVKKVDLSDLKTHNGKVPQTTAIEWIKYQVLGLTLSIEWDRSPHAEIALINAHGQEANGHINYSMFGGKLDPGVDDRTGDILFTTTNVAASDSYDVTMCIRLKD